MKIFCLILLLGVLKTSVAQDSLPANNNVKKQSIKLGYELGFVDQKENRRWNFLTAEYGYKFKKAPTFIRLNYADRFELQGLQLEAESYPVISKKIYMYLNVGYSSSSLFPKFRAGSSIYFTLPKSFELEGGFRYLDFPAPVFVYTTSLGKYYKSFLFTVSTFLSSTNAAISSSYFLKTRWYKNDEDFFMLTLGKGVSPDDQARLTGIGVINNLQSYNVETYLENKISADLFLTAKAGWLNQESTSKNYQNQFILGTSLKYRF